FPPWMRSCINMLKYQTNVSIAGIVFKIRSARQAQINWFKKQYRRYLADGKPDIVVCLHSGEYAPGVSKRKPILTRPFCLYADPDSSCNFRVYSRENYIPLGTLMRYLVSLNLFERNGFLMHSCGMVLKGNAYVLAGPSGAGKTTLARLIKRVSAVLSDESTAVSLKNKKYYAYATPFFGDFGKISSNRKAPLKAILFLKQSKRFCHRRLSRPEASVSLVKNIFLSKADLRYNINKVLQISAQAAGRIPCYELEFLPHQSIWKYIENRISPGAR
ncbi:MAG: hypothetical protein JW788_01020, partial [Candidatus Omnitrophica bacterium]|nr:hypothetical protein [Candidatus Omnitrophota bacterium]